MGSGENTGKRMLFAVKLPNSFNLLGREGRGGKEKERRTRMLLKKYV